MCLIHQENIESSQGKTTKSPWKRLIRQQLKPKLTRTVVHSAKVNLNRYWSKFEQISLSRGNLMTFLSVTNKSETITTPPATSDGSFLHQASTMVEDNEVNDNIFNEIVEIEF
ncbi:hypothetical protein Trydic_g15248 [Trypoxylus dichotomus]